MIFHELTLKGSYLIEVEPYKDQRGLFERLFCKEEFKEIKHIKDIVQVNHSVTFKKGAIRGMHFQYPPKAEIKIIKCIQGSVYDVMVDLRASSATFLQWHAEILSAENMKMIYIPEGFAHGFQTLEDNSELLYFHSDSYDKKYESGIRYNDPKLNIKWLLEPAEISDRDKNHKLLDANFTGVIL